MDAAARSHAVFLLPAWSAFGRQSLPIALVRTLGRADSLSGAAGSAAQLARHFEMLPRHASAAALTRQVDVGDAAGAQWLRADPAHVRPDINGARLLGIGERLGLDADDAAALLPALRPVFGDAGFALDAPTPTRWYLRVPAGATLPTFSAPDDALGADLFEHQIEGADARRWRALLNEAQIVLHNHPRNARRTELGLVPVNSLWLWGGGAPVDRIRSDVRTSCGIDDVLQAMTILSGGRASALPTQFSCDDIEGRTVFDLRRSRDLAQLSNDWLLPACDALLRGRIAACTFDALDGCVHLSTRAQRWRFWRKPWSLPAA